VGGVGGRGKGRGLGHHCEQRGGGAVYVDPWGGGGMGGQIEVCLNS